MNGQNNIQIYLSNGLLRKTSIMTVLQSSTGGKILNNLEQPFIGNDETNARQKSDIQEQ